MPSSSSPYHVFAIAGAAGSSGKLGSYLVDELIQAGAEIRVLARASSAETARAAELRSQGVGISVIDYDDPSSLEKALVGVDVLVSSVGIGGLAVQPVLAKASKAAGVKLFVPSEFGFDTTSVEKDSPTFEKQQLQQYLLSLELPYTLFFTGLFAEYISFFLSPQDGKLEIVGDGKSPVSCTSQLDIARFLAHVLTTLPPSELHNRTFRLEGSRASFIDLVPVIERKAGTVQVVHATVEESLERFKTNGQLIDFVKADFALGKATTGTVSQVEETRALFKEWNPKPVEEFLK